MYRNCNSASEQSACVGDLAATCFRLKKQFGYSDPDARTVALDAIGAIAQYGAMNLNLLANWSEGNELARHVIPQVTGLLTVTAAGVQEAGDIISKCGKLALVTLTQFQIENALRNVGRELGVASPGVGFYRCAKDVLCALGLPATHLETLNVAAKLRNSLHTNGIHHKLYPSEKAIVVLKGVKYEFQDGIKVSCASWEHTAHALECSIEVLEQVFRHPQVASIPDPMMDVYAWEQATAP